MKFCCLQIPSDLSLTLWVVVQSRNHNQPQPGWAGLRTEMKLPRQVNCQLQVQLSNLTAEAAQLPAKTNGDHLGNNPWPAHDTKRVKSVETLHNIWLLACALLEQFSETDDTACKGSFGSQARKNIYCLKRNTSWHKSIYFDCICTQ